MTNAFDTFSSTFVYASLAYVAIAFIQYAWYRSSADEDTRQRSEPIYDTDFITYDTSELPDNSSDEQFDEWVNAYYPDIEKDIPDNYYAVDTMSERPTLQRPPVPQISMPKQMIVLPVLTVEVETMPTTVRKLRLLCKDKGIKGASRFTKARCISELDNIEKQMYS